MKIPLSRPDITHKEIKSVNDVLSTPNLSLGPKIGEFERKFAEYTGSRYAISVNSGTSGLHLCIKALGIKDDDEVITTPFSFIASANCILFERAKPVFVDINPDTLNIDTEKIKDKITKKTKAILPVHVFGYPCSMHEIMDIAKNFNLKVIEDACEALGAEFDNHKVGSLGTCGVFGFYPNKQITTGEGGMIVTNNEKIAKFCQSMRNQGRGPDRHWLEHRTLGFNYRLSDINCALGIAQLERIDEILKKRESVAFLYHKRLRVIKQIKLPHYNSESIKRSWFVYVIQLDKRFSRLDRNNIVEGLRRKGIECGIYFPPIHLQLFYKKEFGYKRGDFPVTEATSDRTIALPFYNNLKVEQIKYACKVLERLLK